MKHKKLAIIDMGSNSIRLVINLIQYNGCYKELYNCKVVARLSSHINENDEITKKGIKIITDTVKQFADILQFHNIEEVNGVATAAVRKAKNQIQVLNEIKKETGYTFRVLSEYEEAFYGYLAVVNSMNIENGITIDIGGGSTEITLFRNRKLKHSHSFPFGAITLQQMFIKNEKPSNIEMNDLNQFLIKKFSTLPWLPKQNLPIIGIGGTARNLSLIHQRKTEYPLKGLHQYEMSLIDIHDVQAELLNLSLSQRQNIDGLSKDRADIIIPGIETICALVEFTNAPKFILSNKGLRDGVFYEEILNQLNVEVFPNVAKESFFQLSHSYKMTNDRIEQIFHIAASLYEELSPYMKKDITLNPDSDRQLLRYSSHVLYIGEFISAEASSQHTFYLLTNMTIDGLNHEERLALAFIASFKSQTQINYYYDSFKSIVTKEQLTRYELLGAILKFSYALNHTGRNIIQDCSVTKYTKNRLALHILSKDDYYFEEQFAQKHKKHLERVLSQRIDIQFERSSN